MVLNVAIKEKEPKVYLLSLSGEINTETHETLTQKAGEILNKAAGIIIDMTEVSYVSSMGLSAIFRLKLALEERKGTLALVNLQPKVALVFDAMKVLTPQMFASLQEADEYLDSFLDGVQKGTIQPRAPQD